MSTSSLRRQVKNIVHNYSEAEIKVREATSNDPWGPSSSLMCEIADLTYNVVAFSEIMGMLWRRLNDHGKNWRHVYKALTLAEYLVKTGSERVAQQCRENIYAVQTLRDFQYVDRDGKDQGLNVREKAKQLVALLKDNEKLQEERANALKTKQKLAQVATVASAPVSAPASSSGSLHSPPEMEQAWPQSSGEEELQLQLALAMSKEEADQHSPTVPSEDLQMRLALSLSKEEHDKVVTPLASQRNTARTGFRHSRAPARGLDQEPLPSLSLSCAQRALSLSVPRAPSLSLSPARPLSLCPPRALSLSLSPARPLSLCPPRALSLSVPRAPSLSL
ncbi:epsin-1, partial [Mustelus asterias]